MSTISSNTATLTLPTSGNVTIPSGTDTLVNLAGTQTLSAKSFVDSTLAIVDLADNTKIINFNAGGTTGTTTTITAAQTANRVFTLPDATTTAVGTDTTQTLTNKTLTSPTITTPTITGTGTATLNSVTLNTGLTLPTSGGTPTTFNYYEEGTFTINFTGTSTINNYTCYYTRVGHIVLFVLPSNTGTASSGSSFTATGIPSRLQPFAAKDGQIWVQDNSTQQTSPGRIVFSGGGFSIYKANQTTSFTASGNAGWSSYVTCWTV